MSEKLKPCPFCGGEAIVRGSIVTYNHVACRKCNSAMLGDTKEEAIELWNTRPNPWHTGTPTEENCFYALQCKGRIHHEPYYGVVVNGKFSAINYDGDLMPLPPDLVAWQKIEPYRG